MIKKSMTLFILNIFFNMLHAEEIKNQQSINIDTITKPPQQLQIQSHQQAIWIKQQQQLLKQQLDIAIKNIPMLSLEKL